MPHLYFYMGLSGSGKTTTAYQFALHNPNCVVLDSDALRQELLGNATSQENNALIFSTMFSRTIEGLRQNRDVFYVATNLTMKRRIQFIQNVRTQVPSAILHCVIINTPLFTCLEWNKQRDRIVPDDVILRQVRSWQTPIKEEGWDTIGIITPQSYDVDAFALEIQTAVLNFGSQENEHHTLSLYDHGRRCYELATSAQVPYVLRRAALWHDCGKIYTKEYWPTKDDNAHYPNHANVGAYLCLNMGLPRYVAVLVNYHMEPYNPQSRPTWAARLGSEIWSDILLLHQFDKEAH